MSSRPGTAGATTTVAASAEDAENAAAASGPAGTTPERPVIATARGLVKTYGRGEAAVRALDDVDVDLERGRLTAIMGPSGSGKSTLMHCLAGLDSPTAGTVVVDGETVSAMSERRLTRLRRTRIGFVFQSFNLVPTLTAEENIVLPLAVARRPVDREWFDRVVDAVGLRPRLGHRPAELSGGQQQRVACARALVSRPAVVFADEPTGNLDSRAAAEVLGFLRASVDDLGQSVAMVTHDPTAASYAHRVLFLADGRLVTELRDPTPQAVLDTLGALTPAAPTGAHAAPAASEPAAVR
ncbi:putative ABC transport system ATP-binding protein [Cellulosimicrobium cellulans]|uniref:ABC transporter ATP-binding protein n=1 Tax=Cellulosimicrobium cellulans TaxID=1710 RepID=UPI00195C2964|nr:ABC transporter ATP-binding protein [Cellulosimicrobium cellulans]MBM7821458.1 putative ABC transport system ATP-binding protein [Cellulosimicrobium cellulans]